MTIQAHLIDNQVLVSTFETLVLTVLKDGAAEAVTSAAYILYDSGNEVKQMGNATISGAESNILTINIPDDLFQETEENLRAEWSIVIGGESEIFVNFFDVVLYKLFNPVTTDDLAKEFPDLIDHLPETMENWQAHIDAAYDEVVEKIKNRGNRPALIVDMSQFFHPIKLNALSKIFWYLHREPGDKWHDSAQRLREQFEDAFRETRFIYSSAGDGLPDREAVLGNIEVSR